MDDFGETAGTSGPIVLNSFINGDIEAANDKDWFSIALIADNNYRIKVEGFSNGNGTLIDPVLSGVFDSGSAAIPGAFNDDGGNGLNSELVFTPATSATHYFEVSAFEATTGTYKITIEENPDSNFSIGSSDFAKPEGDADTTPFVFTVTRSGDTSTAASVDWAVAGFGVDGTDATDFDGGAAPGPSGVLNFTSGQTSQIIVVDVAGDVVVESNETFSVTLSNPSTGNGIGTGSKLGVVLDDDAPDGGALLAISIDDSSIFEGDLGTTAYNFTVTRSGDTAIAASATWTVAAFVGSDSLDSDDFDGGVLPAGLVSFAPGETSKPVTILVAGDLDAEPDEVFSVTLSAPSAQTSITSASKLATILNDEDDDFGQTILNSGQIGLGGSKVGNIEVDGDQDWFGVDLIAGSYYQIDLEEAAANQGPFIDPFIEGIYDANGVKVTGTTDSDSGTGTNSQFGFIPDADGKYYISASSELNTTGRYQLFIVFDPNDAPTGEVKITGDPIQKLELTVSNTLYDADGIGTITYQWLANGIHILGATDNTFTPTLNEVGQTITVEASYTDDHGYAENISSNPTAPIASLSGLLIEGGPGDEVLLGTVDDDIIRGFGGRDTLEGLAGNDILEGGDGINHALFQNNSSDYTITNDDGQIDVSGPNNDGDDNLRDIHRLHFKDQSLAFDLDGNAAQMVKLLGLILGAETWLYKEYMGIGLDQLDNTNMTYNEMFDYWYAEVLGPNPSNTAVMELIYTNLFGFAPTPEDLTTLTEGILDNGLLTQSGLGVLLADYEGHVANMDFPGLEVTGVAYFEVTESAAGLLVEGDTEDNEVDGDTGNDTLNGNAGDDTLQGFAGVDELDGGDGLDHAIFQNDLVDYSIVNNEGQLDILGPVNDGYNKLTDIERLHFQDQSRAYDIDGNAGQMMKILGVILGADNWYNKEYLGIGIDQLDNTDITYEGMMDYWFAEVLGPSPSNTAVMNLVYTNIFGFAPTPEDLTTLTEDILDAGLLTQAGLGVLLADYEGNATNIGLLGYTDAGVDYFAI